jgi:hypothetical protein
MRVHADPTPMVTEALREFFTATAAAVAAFGVVRVVAEQVPDPDGPSPWTPDTDAPLVTVHDDGGPEQWPIKRDPIIRVTVRARGLPLAKKVATWAQGHLHEHVPAGLAYVSRNGAGLVTGRDSDTGADLASFTVTATLTTITV